MAVGCIDERAETVWDVIVVGAGPAGSTLATILGRRGRRVLLLDRQAFPRPKVCGHYLNSVGIGALAANGIRLEWGRCPHSVIRGAQLLTATGVVVEATFSTGSSLGIVRTDLDALLLETARAVPAVRLLAPCAVRDVITDDGRVVGVTAVYKGTETTFRGRWIVAADGIQSVIGSRLGCTSRHRHHRKFGIMAPIGGLRAPSDMLSIFPLDFHANSDPLLPKVPCYLGFTPVGEQYLCGLIIDERDFHLNRGRVAEVFKATIAAHPILRNVFGGATLPRTFEVLGPLAREGRAPSLDNVLLIGDAAGFYDPFTGDGIAHALESAVLGAEAIDAALADRVTARRAVTTYHRRRRRRLQSANLLARMMQWMLGHPVLFNWILSRMEGRPELCVRLADGMAGQKTVWRIFTPTFVARLLLPASRRRVAKGVPRAPETSVRMQ